MHNLSSGLLLSIMTLQIQQETPTKALKDVSTLTNMNVEFRKKLTLKYQLKTQPRLPEQCGELSSPSDKSEQALRLNMD